LGHATQSPIAAGESAISVDTTKKCLLATSRMPAANYPPGVSPSLCVAGAGRR
jgi:hypothetical protein